MVKPKLLDQVRYAIRVRHLSYRTEQAYVHWIRQKEGIINLSSSYRLNRCQQ